MVMVISLELSTSQRVCWFYLNVIIMMRYNAVEMIKQFPERVDCRSLAFHGDVIYIGSINSIIQWSVGTDAVVRLEEYPAYGLY